MRFAFPIATLALVLFALPAVGVFVADVLGYGPELNAWIEERTGLSHQLALSIAAAILLFLVPVGIIILHLLRLRRQPQVVSSTLLWHASIEDFHANALLRWLRRNVPLLLQLLAAFLFIYAVLGPRLHGETRTGRHYILIIDNSASMSASDVETSRLEWAKTEALKTIDAATDHDSGMVIVFNRTAEIRQSYTTDRELLRAAVRGIEPSAAQTRFDEALQLAAGLANPARSTENEAARPENVEPGKERTYVPAEGMEAEVHLFSDGGFPAVEDFALANLAMRYHAPPIPTDAANLAITQLDATRGENGRLTATGTVRSFFPQPAQVVAGLDVLQGDDVLRSYSQTITVEANGEREVVFDISELGSAVRLTISSEEDRLALDDIAWLALGTTRKAQVLVVGPSNDVLDSFLDSPKTLDLADITRLAPADMTGEEQYRTPIRTGRFDLVLFDRCAPSSAEEMPRANTVFIGSRPPGLSADATAVKNPRVVGWVGAHPVTRDLHGLYDIPIASAVRLGPLPPRTERLIESDNNVVLLAGIPRPPFTDLVLAFPIVTADGKWNTLWQLDPSFVKFLRNVVRTYGNLRDGLSASVTQPGDAVTVRTAGAERITITIPSGRTEGFETGTAGEVTFTETSELGVYSATFGDTTLGFAVNLMDANESNLTPRPTVQVGHQTVTAGDVQQTPRELWKWAIIAGLLVVVAEWWLYASRVR